MKKCIHIIVVIAAAICLNACQHDKPKPESEAKEITLKNTESVPVSNTISQKEPFFVQSQIKGKDIYIECIVKGISFRKNPSGGNEGKLAVFVDGTKVKEITAAAFIIRGLPSGNHKIKMVVLKPDNHQYGLEKEFSVTIP